MGMGSEKEMGGEVRDGKIWVKHGWSEDGGSVML